MSIKEDAHFLIIRRDNIGDLLCTTPLMRALRLRFPSARISALVNSYNAPVLAGNRDLDAVHSYEKLKHLPAGRSRTRALVDRLGMILTLRRRRADFAILAAPGFQQSALRFARLVAPRHVIGYSGPGGSVDMAIEDRPDARLHEVERCFRLLEPLGISGKPPAMSLAAEGGELAAIRARPGWAALAPAEGPLVGLHISARKQPQRWPVERFAQLAHRLRVSHGARFLLFWAPGRTDNALHPGDDEKAAALTAQLPDLPLSLIHISEPTRPY
jgi:ADP-heptose:LPS heptosyltransferase